LPGHPKKFCPKSYCRCVSAATPPPPPAPFNPNAPGSMCVAEQGTFNKTATDYVCCASSCGTCGGPKCGDRDGGKDNCCVNIIAANAGNKTCDNDTPPCIVKASTTQALEVAGPVGGNPQCIPEGYDCDNTYQCCKDLTCTDTTDPPFQKSVCSDNREPTIARVASAFPGLSQFVKALKTAKLLTILDNDAPCPSCPAHHSGPFTVFAPNDEAFAALPKATLAHLLDPKNIKELQAVLKYHIATGQAGAICFPMDDAACYRMSGPGEPPSSAPVIYGAAIAANLKSPCWHINGNPHLDPCWINQTVKTLQGQDVSVRYKCKEVYGESICDGGQFADNSKVTSDNFSGRNGVMHIIDRVLIPPTTLDSRWY